MTGASRLPERLRVAAAAVDEAGLPVELRAAGFVLAFWGTESASRPQAGRTAAASGGQSRSVSSGDLAARLSLDQDVLAKVYSFEDDDVVLIFPRRVLDPHKRAAMAEVTHLVVAAHQSAGREWTRAEEVRSACADLGVLDGNFGAVVQQLNGEGFRVKGKGANRELKMNATGFETTADLVGRLSAGLS